MNNERSLNDARLDRAIDRAVREMMQVDPAPGLRRRVLSRINAPVERRVLPVLRYTYAAVAAVIVVVVLSLTLMPGHVQAPTPPQAPPLVFAGGAPPIVLPDLKPMMVGLPGSNNEVATYEAIPMPRVTDVFGAQPSGVSAATIREPETIRVAPEILAPLTIVPLSARPIVVESLVLPAMPK